jgi:hypothetical protein
MSFMYAVAGGTLICAGALWAGKGVRGLLATRGATTVARSRDRRRRDRRQQWQWLGLGGLDLALGACFIAGLSRPPAVVWWLIAAYGSALGVWMFVTDIGSWLSSRLKARSRHAQS